MGIIDWILRILRMGRGIISLVLCLLFSMILLSMEKKEKRIFHEVAISTFLFPAQYVVNQVNTSMDIWNDNKVLKQENARLRMENDLLLQRYKESERLNELAEYRFQSGFALKLAKVSAQDPGRFASSWIINVGEKDSVKANMPVLTGKGVVGRIAKTYSTHSLVQLLYDPNVKISVMVNRSRVKGIMETFKPGVLVSRFPAYSDIQNGDTLITSGMGGVFPKGMLVGEVEDQNLEAGDILKGVEVNPFQNPYLVEELFVLLREPTWQATGEKE